MKILARTFAGILLVTLVGACSQQGGDETAATAPAETAEEFVARANAELKELGREQGAAEWIRVQLTC